MNLRLILIPLLLSAALSGANAVLAQDKGTVDPKPLPPLANPNDPKLGAKELFARKLLPARNADAGDRLLFQRLHRGRRGAMPDQWRHLAGDAAVAQSQLGTSRSDRAFEAAVGQGAQGCRLAADYWSATWHSRAAARRSAAMPAIRSGSTPISG